MAWSDAARAAAAEARRRKGKKTYNSMEDPATLRRQVRNDGLSYKEMDARAATRIRKQTGIKKATTPRLLKAYRKMVYGG